MKSSRSIARCLSLLAGAFVAGSLASNAADIATDFFNGYGEAVINTSGLSGGTGAWTSNWSASDATYVPGGSLSYSATGYDNSTNLSGSGDGAFTGTTDTTANASTTYRTLDDGDASTVWFSALIFMDGSDRALLWVDATSNATWGLNDFVGILDGQIAMRYNTGTTGGTSVTIGTVGAWGDNTNPNANETFTSGTALLLAKAEINYDGTFDRLSFWFNPDLSGGEGGLGVATITSPADIDFLGDEIGGVGILIAGTNGGNEYLDAVRVGTTFDDVTLGAVVEPKITSITKSGNTVTVEFTGAEGQTYGLNKSTDLDFTTTPAIVDTTAVSGGTGTLEDTSATEEKAFYRVESQ